MASKQRTLMTGYRLFGTADRYHIERSSKPRRTDRLSQNFGNRL